MSTSARARRRIQLGRIPVRYVAEGVEGVGRVKNISRNGLFVRCDEDLPRPGVPIALQFEAPTGDTINLRGEIRWNSEGMDPERVSSGFGVQLHEPSREFRDFFRWAAEQSEKDE